MQMLVGIRDDFAYALITPRCAESPQVWVRFLVLRTITIKCTYIMLPYINEIGCAIAETGAAQGSPRPTCNNMIMILIS
jgi:hypothetical protein